MYIFIMWKYKINDLLLSLQIINIVYTHTKMHSEKNGEFKIKKTVNFNLGTQFMLMLSKRKTE